MTGKISKKNIVENSTEVSLKTSSDFQSPSNYQELQSSTQFDGNTMSTTMQQANMKGNFAEVLANNQANNINKISDEINQKRKERNQKPSITVSQRIIKLRAVWAATININPYRTKTAAAATISLKPRNTFSVNVGVEDDGSSSSQDCQEEATDMRKSKRKCVTNTNK